MVPTALERRPTADTEDAPKGRKVVIVGSTRMLTQSSFMLFEPSVQQW